MSNFWQTVNEKVERRFWARVALPDADDCMTWLGASDGLYGNTQDANRRGVTVHRLSQFLAAGQPPTPRHQAAHSCRNTLCVAPAHLRWATPAENEADKRRDGTHVEGEGHPLARLKDAEVLAIRSEYAAGGVNQRALAAKYGVSQPQIGRIIRGERRSMQLVKPTTVDHSQDGWQ